MILINSTTIEIITDINILTIFRRAAAAAVTSPHLCPPDITRHVTDHSKYVNRIR